MGFNEFKLIPKKVFKPKTQLFGLKEQDFECSECGFMALVEVAKVSDIKEGKGKTVKAGGKQIAVFNVGGKFHATDNTCLHRGGPLGEGSLSDSVVTCPWHGWQYDVTSGACKTNPVAKLQSYKVKVDGDKVMVEV